MIKVFTTVVLIVLYISRTNGAANWLAADERIEREKREAAEKERAAKRLAAEIAAEAARIQAAENAQVIREQQKKENKIRCCVGSIVMIVVALFCLAMYFASLM